MILHRYYSINTFACQGVNFFQKQKGVLFCVPLIVLAPPWKSRTVEDAGHRRTVEDAGHRRTVEDAGPYNL